MHSILTKICFLSTCDHEHSIVLTLKSDSHLPKKVLIILFNDSPSKMMKNVFCFILKCFLFHQDI